MYKQGKIPSGTSFGQMGKQHHAGAIKPDPGFCGSGFDSSRVSVSRSAG